MATPNIPSAFDGFDVIEGFDPIDKTELVGKPFGITGVRFRTSGRGVAFAEIEIVDGQGEPAAFQDASSGVRDQLGAYLDSKGLKVTSEWQDIKLYVPRGLRVSEYEIQDASGQTKKAKTFYLTTAGRSHSA